MRRVHQAFLSVATAAVALGVGASGAMGGVYESFDYAPGALGNQGGWGLYSTNAPSSAQVVEGSLTFGSYVTQGNKLKLIGEKLWLATGDIDWNSDSVTYISFLVNATGTHVDGSARFVNIGLSNLEGVEGRGWTGLYSRGRVGIDNLWPNSDFSPDGVYSVGTTVFMVLKITISTEENGDSIELSYYATPESLINGTPDAVQYAWTHQINVTDHIQFRIGANVTEAFIDELRVGSNQAEVMLPIPEPASLVLMGFGGLLMLRRRH